MYKYATAQLWTRPGAATADSVLARESDSPRRPAGQEGPCPKQSPPGRALYRVLHTRYFPSQALQAWHYRPGQVPTARCAAYYMYVVIARTQVYLPPPPFCILQMLIHPQSPQPIDPNSSFVLGLLSLISSLLIHVHPPAITCALLSLPSTCRGAFAAFLLCCSLSPSCRRRESLTQSETPIPPTSLALEAALSFSLSIRGPAQIHAQVTSKSPKTKTLSHLSQPLPLNCKYT